MAFEITEWNLNPNQEWFVKIKDVGSTASVTLYETAADAVAETNVFATVTGIAFGTNVSVVLVPVVADSISYFNDQLAYHLKISGVDSDPDITFQISAFVDLPDIDNSIYTSAALIQQKAINEINKHTHAAIRKDIGLANHSPNIKVGDICAITSTVRGINVLAIIEEINIIGTVDSLINQISTVEYTDLNYV